MTSRLRETPVSSYTPALPLPRRGHRLHDEPTIKKNWQCHDVVTQASGRIDLDSGCQW